MLMPKNNANKFLHANNPNISFQILFIPYSCTLFIPTTNSEIPEKNYCFCIFFLQQLAPSTTISPTIPLLAHNATPTQPNIQFLIVFNTTEQRTKKHQQNNMQSRHVQTRRMHAKRDKQDCCQR